MVTDVYDRHKLLSMEIDPSEESTPTRRLHKCNHQCQRTWL